MLSVTDVQDGGASFFSLAIGVECRTAADCSNHGTCDTKTGDCRCESDYSGAKCGTLVASPYYPGSQLVTVDWGKQLNEWKGKADQRWVLCYSSFTDNSSTPAVFHRQCDIYNNTLSVAHNSGGRACSTSFGACQTDSDCSGSSNLCKINTGNYTFGGFVRLAHFSLSLLTHACCSRALFFAAGRGFVGLARLLRRENDCRERLPTAI